MLKKWINFILLLFGLIYVPAVFSYIHPKQVASLYAGAFFILLGITIIYVEFKKGELFGLMGILSVIFTVCFAIPIFYMRIAYWGESFETLSFLGVPTKIMHSVSSVIYVSMFFVEIVRIVKSIKKEIR